MNIVLKAVNEFNELLDDWIIPRLFTEFYDLQLYTRPEEYEAELVKTPSPPNSYYCIQTKPDLVALLISVMKKSGEKLPPEPLLL